MRSVEWITLLRGLALSAAVWPGLLGCDSGAARRQLLGSGNPLDRAQAVVKVTEARDHEAVHKLVDLLEDPDGAVRMYAIIALRRLCVEDFGYRYYAGSAERATAVRRWREALRAGEVVLLSTTQRDNGNQSENESSGAAETGGATAERGLPGT